MKLKIEKINTDNYPFSDSLCEEYGTPWNYMLAYDLDRLIIIAWPEYKEKWASSYDNLPKIVKTFWYSDYPPCKEHYEIMVPYVGVEYLTEWPKHWRWRVFKI